MFKRVAVLSSGAGLHGERFADVCNFDYIPQEQKKIDNYNVLWFVGFFDYDAFTLSKIPEDFANIVVQFIGSDISLVNERINHFMNSECGMRYNQYSVRRDTMIENLQRVKVVAVAPQLIEELREVGIDAELMPLIATERREVFSELGDKVLCFSNPRYQLFSTNKLLDTANIYRDIEFVFYGSGKFNVPLDNVSHMGWLNEEEKYKLYKECRCFVRSALHDGCSQAVLECKQVGMNVIWGYKYPYVKYFDFLNGTPEELGELIGSIPNTPDIEGAKYYTDTYSRSRVRTQALDILDTLGA